MSEEIDLSNTVDLLSAFDFESEVESREQDIVRAPFGYPGSKYASLEHILPRLPYRDSYIEPFGGTGSVLLNRRESILEVFNDRYAGITAFYQCIRDPKKLQALSEWIDFTVHSREDFLDFKNNWNVQDPIERAGRWLYITQYSFNQLGKQFGRGTGSHNGVSGKLRNKITFFPKLHHRLKKVLIENQSWEAIVKDFDHDKAVFYMDPPYIHTTKCYFHNFTVEDHKRLLNKIFEMEAFVAISGYDNELYNSYPWHERFTWKVNIYGETRSKNIENFIPKDFNKTAEEVLWIKEAR